ncbi:MAG: polymer-forming cytoskeletal protein [Pseudomonadota bacterium]
MGKEKIERIDTIIGHHAYFEGTISSKEGLRIDGSVKGNIQCEGSLVIGSAGKVAAEIVADNVLIAGEFTGNITAKDRLEITEKGKVNGDVTTVKFVMAPGVIFDGRCHMHSRQVLLEPVDSLSLPAPLVSSAPPGLLK